MRIGAVAVLASVLALTACTPTGDTIVSGRFTPDEPVSLQNLTVNDGRYLVSFTLELFVASQSGDVELTCVAQDTTGRLAQLPGLARTVSTGSWQLAGGQNEFELPDITMGIRCYPDRDATLQVVVRDVQLTAEPLD